MRSSFFYKNKKGQEGSGTWGLKEISVLVICSIAAFFLIDVGSTLYAATLGQKDEGSKANLNRLYDNVKILLEKSDERAYIEDSYFLGKDRIVVGFDTLWDETHEVIDFRLWDDYNIYKPSSCGTSACLCLYTDDWDPRTPESRNKGLVGRDSCRSETFAGKNIVFFSERGNVNPKTKGTQREDVSGNYLIFYGDEWGTQPIYIEKEYKKGENKYYIYISTINKQNPNDPATLRKQQIDSSKQFFGGGRTRGAGGGASFD